MAVRSNYYVYEHWRLDRDECFYVGKGNGDRAYRKGGRGSHWKNIVFKLERTGFAYEIRMVVTGVTEEEAHKIERERIAFWRDKVDLANKTDGGEGVSGLKMSDESKHKMRLAKLGKPGVKSMLGRKHSEETKAKMSAARLGKPSNNKGWKMSDEQRQALSERSKKMWMNPEHRQKAIRTEISEETRAKLSAAAAAQWADPNKRPNRKREKLS